MAKIFHVRTVSTSALQKRKAAILAKLLIPSEVVRASSVRQYLTCGKKNCRCRRGHKHGPFQYFVQSLAPGKTRKFLLRTTVQKKQAGAGIAAYVDFQEKLEELSQINTELLRRGEDLKD